MSQIFCLLFFFGYHLPVVIAKERKKYKMAANCYINNMAASGHFWRKKTTSNLKDINKMGRKTKWRSSVIRKKRGKKQNGCQYTLFLVVG